MTTTPHAVAFPTRNPWLEAESRDLDGKSVLALKFVPGAGRAARLLFERNHSGFAPTGQWQSRDLISARLPRSLYLPPFGMFLIPVQREDSSKISIRSNALSLVLFVLKPRPGRKRAFSVDSSIVFQEVR